VLGNDAGEIFVRGKIYDHLGEFDKVYLSNGLEFSPGEYDYIVHLNERHWINSYLPALSAIKFFRDLNKKFTVEGTDLIFASSPRDFDFKLTKFKTDSFNKLAKPLQDKIERINTIGALLDQMTLLFEETMNMSKSGKDFQKFEKVYQKDIGSVLQNLVTDRTNEFTAANEIIKSVAKLYATIVAKTSKLKKIESKFKVKIISEVKAESASIQLEVNKIKSSLETELNKLKM
jgi:K+/H+ antiporter YhaU regulatory subunit KhtT